MNVFIIIAMAGFIFGVACALAMVSFSGWIIRENDQKTKEITNILEAYKHGK